MQFETACADWAQPLDADSGESESCTCAGPVTSVMRSDDAMLDSRLYTSTLRRTRPYPATMAQEPVLTQAEAGTT